MKTTIHIATSLDGFVADAANSVHWLESLSSDIGVFERILPFMQAVDGVVLGRKTYEAALEYGEWPYRKKQCLVVTSSTAQPTTPDTYFIRPEEVMDKANALGIQHLWVVGGGQLNGYMVEQGWIDELIVTVSPIVLGNGQPLMASLGKHTLLQLFDLYPLPDGFIELSYRLQRT
ncbi:MAG: dihydrofolate reductase family protein [Bacteroidetes bacterium]|nr:dihydrofolate reductase family protein [Bacteroidota bacterium]MBL0015955.1 dihydrofolate reductase family protein [Bacteroidota bacterium]